MRFRVTGGICAALSLVAAAAAAEGPTASRVALTVAAKSVGAPDDGALVGGVPLEPNPEIRLRWPDGPRWALPSLVSMLERAAQRVGRRFPGSVLLVGDLSRREGGSLPGHASHESGRDADVGFYYTDAGGRVVRTERLVRVEPTGEAAATPRELRFDAARNWALVEAFLTDPEVIVQRIFVAEPVRRILLDYARSSRTPARLVARAARAMRQPTNGPPHDDHFHVRIACPKRALGVCEPQPKAARRTSSERTAALRDSLR
jgi:penicillin-insensitive murein endopeptidase